MKKSIIALLFCAIAVIMVSCNKDNNNDSNTPLTNETIVGKKYFSDKVYRCVQDNWEQTEILLAENNNAYLTRITTNFETGNESRSEIKKASFNMAYPNIIFEATDNTGNITSYYASFPDNSTLVFEGEQRNLEGSGAPADWRWINGDSFSTSSHSDDGPYTGQVFVYEYTTGLGKIKQKIIRLGTRYAYCSWGENTQFWYTLEINYPNIKMTPVINSGGILGDGSENGSFVDANTIVIGENTFTRTR